MVVVMVGTTAARFRPANEIAANVWIVVLFALVPIALLTARQVRRGAWGNVDASDVRERPLLYAVGISGLGALVAYLAIWRSDSFLLRGSSVALGVVVLCAITTRWIKVSLHVTAAALAATGLILSGSMVGWILAALVPLLIWSRLALGRHKPLEVALGAVVGIAGGIVMRLL
jgi:membrane-associated phospholipid phosphatase